MPLPLIAPLLLKFPLLGRIPWRLVGVVVILLLAWWSIRSYADRVADEREQEIRALWEADTAKRDAENAKIKADAESRIRVALENNARVTEDANQKLADIAADRDSLDRLLRQARSALSQLSASQATGQRGLDALAGIAARAAEVDRRLVEYDAACRADAVRLQALQDQIRPQL